MVTIVVVVLNRPLNNLFSYIKQETETLHDKYYKKIPLAIMDAIPVI